MDKIKNFFIGSLFALPVLYFGCQQNNEMNNEIQLFDPGNAKSIDAKIIAKDELWEGEYLDATFGGYSLITKRNYNGRNIRDTTKIDVPEPKSIFTDDYYKRKVPGWDSKVSGEWYKDLDKFLKVQDAFLKDSLTSGRTVRLWVADTNTTYHTITPDKIELIQKY